MNKQFLTLLIGVLISLAAQSQELHFYFGNIHAHTKFSDGNKDAATSTVSTPAGSYLFASKSDHFDFLGISEHNHSQAGMKYENYAEGLTEADKANKDGRFVAMYGMEFGVIKNGGHVLIYGLDSLVGWEDENFDIFCDKGDYATLWKLIARHPGAFATLAHPENTDFSNLLTSPYNKTADQAICGVAINTGPAFSTDEGYTDKPARRFDSYFKQLLALGYRLGPTIDHDNHYTTFGRMAASRTVILAQSLTRENIMDAYRQMHFYASEDFNAKVNFTIDGQIMGSTIPLNKADFALSLSISDDDNEAVSSVKIMFGVPGSGQTAKLLTSGTANALTFTGSVKKGETFYYYAEITQADGDKIVTSPIWVNRK